MDNRPTLTVRARFLPHLLSCLPAYCLLMLFTGVVSYLYYHDGVSTFSAVCTIAFLLCIHAVMGLLQRPTLRFLGSKLYIRCRWDSEQELINLRARDFTLTQSAADKRRNTGTLHLKDARLPAFAAKGGVNRLRGVEDFDQVIAYVRKHFRA